MFALMRWSLVALLAGAVAVVARDPGTPPDSLGRVLADALPGDPDAQSVLRRRYGGNPAPLVAIREGMPAQFPSVLRRAAKAARDGTPAPLPDLAEMALDPALTSEQREAFLHAHASVLEQFAGHPEAEEAYLRDLTRARGGAGDFAEVRDDPVGVLVFGAVADPGLRRYYLDHRDWLAEVLPELEPADSDVADPAVFLAEMLAAVRDHHALAREAVVGLQLGSPGVALALHHAPLLKACAAQGLPLEESLEAIHANPAFTEGRPPTEVAADFRRARDAAPAVWNAARAFPLWLQLFRDAPEPAVAVASRKVRTGTGAAARAEYEGWQVQGELPGFLYTVYPEQVRTAAEAVALYGDGAWRLLNDYAEAPVTRERFRQELGRHGARVVPYLLSRGDAGLEELAADPRNIDKFTAPDGSLKDPEWWTKLPGGAAGNVVRNWYRGYPNDWGELGWAALDVVDGALLVASLGSSSALTVAKQGATAAGKKVAAGEVRALVAGAARFGSRTGRLERASRFAAGKVPSLLKRTLAASAPAFRAAGYAVTIGGRAVSFAGRTAVHAAARLKQTWTAAPAAVRLATYRALLATGLAVTLYHRTLPTLADAAAAIPEWVERVVREAVQTVGQKLVAGVNAVLGTDLRDPGLVRAVGRVAVGGAAGVLALYLAWGGLRHRRRGVVRVA